MYVNEIKVEYGGIESILSAMESKADMFDPKLNVKQLANNQMELIHYLQENNRLLEQVMSSYKLLLMKNHVITRESVKSLRETDTGLSTSIRQLKE
nr:DUF5344 family protein [Sutcliffiella horikoshii]